MEELVIAHLGTWLLGKCYWEYRQKPVAGKGHARIIQGKLNRCLAPGFYLSGTAKMCIFVTLLKTEQNYV
jgi:hypothetical protein